MPLVLLSYRELPASKFPPRLPQAHSQLHLTLRILSPIQNPSPSITTSGTCPIDILHNTLVQLPLLRRHSADPEMAFFDAFYIMLELLSVLPSGLRLVLREYNYDTPCFPRTPIKTNLF
ncbi:hypothetical protein BGX38DRAFT_1167961 [Terfezia claveryi]|nr:hypothetical protein BGX38DRAFT_1167961 [Terfezia claveryi]